MVDCQLGDVRGDSRDLLSADADHEVVVVGVVGDVAGALLLLEAADPVLEAGRPRQRPLAGERLRISYVRQKPLAVVRLGGECGEMSGRSATSGTSQGSEPFAR